MQSLAKNGKFEVLLCSKDEAIMNESKLSSEIHRQMEKTIRRIDVKLVDNLSFAVCFTHSINEIEDEHNLAASIRELCAGYSGNFLFSDIKDLFRPEGNYVISVRFYVFNNDTFGDDDYRVFTDEMKRD